MEERLFCPVRKRWIAALPEEKVRQRLVSYMIGELGYPAAHLILEKALDALPHLQQLKIAIPERRADIICVAPGIHPAHALFPLLLIECKALTINEQAFKQVIGYNHYLRAPFIALANDRQVRTAWHDGRDYQFADFLPAYKELVASQIDKSSHSQ